MAQENERSLPAVCWVIAATLGCFLCLLQLGAMLSIMARHAGFRLVGPSSLVAAILIGRWLARHELRGSPRLRWIPSATVLVVILLAVAVSAFYYDLSWDGQWYHQTAILHIAADWNPLTDPMHKFTPDLQVWVRHYPKGPWYQSAVIYNLTRHIEPAKCLQWIALAGMFSAVLALLTELGLRRAPALFLASLLSLNPVIVSELTGFMVDGIMFSFLTVAIASMISSARSPGRAVTVAGITASILAINAKFTGLVFLCIALIAVLAWGYVQHRAGVRRLAATACASLVLGVCVWGYNPYITNTVAVHQPFYPILGSARFPPVDHIEREETPRNMRGRNRLVRFGYAIFGRPGNPPYFIGRDATLMLPFAARPADLYSYTYQETRIAGFGPWFSGCLLLSLMLAAWLVASRTPGRWVLLLACATIVVSLSLSRHLWWPRYGPQLWWLAIAPLVLGLHSARPRLQRNAAWLVASLLLLNACIVAGVRMHWETGHSIAMRDQLEEMHNSGKEYRVSTRFFPDSVRERLAEAGVSYQDLGRQKLPNAHSLMDVVEHYPDGTTYLADGEMPAPSPPPVPPSHLPGNTGAIASLRK